MRSVSDGQRTGGALVAPIIAVAMSLGSYFYGNRIVLASTRAKEVSKEDAPRLHNLVEGLAIAAGTPTPKVWIVPESAPNAFATGRDPEHSHVAVTQGLLDDEPGGAGGRSGTRWRTSSIATSSWARSSRRSWVPVLLAEFFMDVVVGLGSAAGGGAAGGGAASAIIFAVGFSPLILAPIFGQLIRLAVSRNREFLADAQGAMLALSAGADRRAHEAASPVGARALREQRDRAPLAESALAAGRGAARDAGAAVLDASPARGAHPSPGGDVTFPSVPGGVWADGCPEIVSIVGSREGPVRRFPHISSHPDIENQEAHPWH